MQSHPRHKKCSDFYWDCAIAGFYLEALKCTEIYETKTFVTMGAQTLPNFLIIQMQLQITIYNLYAGVQNGRDVCCNINKNHKLFSRHLDHKYY